MIQSDEKNMLIDGGTNATGGKVVEYLRKEGITSLDYVVGTHGHEDHVAELMQFYIILRSVSCCQNRHMEHTHIGIFVRRQRCEGLR